MVNLHENAVVSGWLVLPNAWSVAPDLLLIITHPFYGGWVFNQQFTVCYLHPSLGLVPHFWLADRCSSWRAINDLE